MLHKTTVEKVLLELSRLGRLSEILTAASAVKAAIDALEKATELLNEALEDKPKALQVATAKRTKEDRRKNAPPRDDVKKRIIAKLHKEGRPMSQAELIKILRHDYYSISVAVKDLMTAGVIKEETVPLSVGGKPTKRTVNGYRLSA